MSTVARQSISALILRLPAGRRRILKTLLDPEFATAGPEEIARSAGVSRSCYWSARQDQRFLEVVEEVREVLLPGAKVRMAQQIIEDALVSLRDVEPGKAGALVKTREQAAGILGIALSTPEKMQHEHQGQGSFVHRMAEEFPREALEEFNATGNWDEIRWGLPPWRQRPR